MTEEHDPMWEPDDEDIPGFQRAAITMALIAFVCWSGIMVFVGTLICG